MAEAHRRKSVGWKDANRKEYIYIYVDIFIVVAAAAAAAAPLTFFGSYALADPDDASMSGSTVASSSDPPASATLAVCSAWSYPEISALTKAQ